MDAKKQRLIDALKVEREQFKARGQSTLEHNVAIDYLETGKTNKHPDDFPLLDAVMNDYETVCSDYYYEDQK